MSQNQQILDYLQSGATLTPLEALQLFGTIAMHSRAAELRERGHDIECTMVELPGGKRVGQYSIPLRVPYG